MAAVNLQIWLLVMTWIGSVNHGESWNFLFDWKATLLACLASASVRFRSKERSMKDEKRDFRFWMREKWNESQKMIEGKGKEGSFLPFFLSLPRSFTRAIFRAVFDSCSSFFAPKPHENGCYAGYNNIGSRSSLVFIQCAFHFFFLWL